MATDSAFVNSAVVVWARTRAGLTHAQLATKMGVPRSKVVAWEEGVNFPSFARAQRLAEVLNIPFGCLFLAAPPPDDLPLPKIKPEPKAKKPAPNKPKAKPKAKSAR